VEQAKPGGRSELEPIQSDPEIRFCLSFLLDIEALVPARAGRWGSSPQGWLPSELLAELLGRPYLSGLHMRFNTRRAEHGFPACNDNGSITLAPTRQHFAIVQSDPQARLASLNFSPIEKIKAALRGIKVVSSISYAKGEERPYGNRVYNRTNGISATGAAPSDRAI
jgi:hypothetical protein